MKVSMNIEIYYDVKTMGEEAATFVAGKLISAIREKGRARLILATGASQFTFLDAFKRIDGINWSAVDVYHLDEYAGLSANHPASFRKYLKERIIDQVNPAKMHYINGDAVPIEMEIKRYSDLLEGTEIDIACIGIGENGHIAFNDPPVADFNDPFLIKKVELDRECRMQQVGEGWFSGLDKVPTHALSLTIPAIMNARTISCVVPDKRKANAVKNALEGPVTTECPASILQKHQDCHMFLDIPSASKLSRVPSPESPVPSP
jgi:glucosamine-6-phosphate deaminase